MFRVTVSIGDLNLLGVKQEGKVPSLFKSEKGSDSSNKELLYVSYEKNPLDKLCGDRIIVKGRSVNVVYDARTIIELIDLFKIQNQETLSQ